MLKLKQHRNRISGASREMLCAERQGGFVVGVGHENVRQDCQKWRNGVLKLIEREE
jgi:hypothetical protein